VRHGRSRVDVGVMGYSTLTFATATTMLRPTAFEPASAAVVAVSRAVTRRSDRVDRPSALAAAGQTRPA
jgi:hypothetical protein